LSDLVVLVPVLGRPAHVAPLLESFAEGGSGGRLLFVADASDTEEREALEAAGAEVLVVDDLVTWPRKINAGYRATTEPWMLLGADDIRFLPGWWEATETARMADFGVIGTNDLGNPRVMAGEHATHALVSRRYADLYGTIDGPGAVVCEEYDHWCVDDELVLTAKARGLWSPCLEAVVRHDHPYWKRGEWDDIYTLGETSAARDRGVLRERFARIGGQC